MSSRWCCFELSNTLLASHHSLRNFHLVHGMLLCGLTSNRTPFISMPFFYLSCLSYFSFPKSFSSLLPYIHLIMFNLYFLNFLTSILIYYLSFLVSMIYLFSSPIRLLPVILPFQKLIRFNIDIALNLARFAKLKLLNLSISLFKESI